MASILPWVRTPVPIRHPVETPVPVNREIFYEWQPDILIGSDSDGFEGAVLRELQSGPQFKQYYIKGELWYHNEILYAYFSRRFIEGLQDGHYAFQQDLQYALNMEDG